MTGAFVAVVGPSGSGKDAIIDAARAALKDGPAYVFPRRCVTRPGGSGEDHDSVTEEAFAAMEAAGSFALSWRAHGLAYGVPASAHTAVSGGAIAVANVSRAILPRLGDAFPRVRVVRVTVSEEVRLSRILGRGRESAEAAATRLARQDPAPGFPTDLDIVNDGPLAESADRLVEFLEHMRVAHP